MNKQRKVRIRNKSGKEGLNEGENKGTNWPGLRNKGTRDGMNELGIEGAND